MKALLLQWLPKKHGVALSERKRTQAKPLPMCARGHQMCKADVQPLRARQRAGGKLHFRCPTSFTSFNVVSWFAVPICCFGNPSVRLHLKREVNLSPNSLRLQAEGREGGREGGREIAKLRLVRHSLKQSRLTRKETGKLAIQPSFLEKSLALANG